MIRILVFASFLVISSPAILLAEEGNCKTAIERLEKKIDKISGLFSSYLEASLKTTKYLSVLQIYNDNLRVLKNRLSSTQKDISMHEISLQNMEDSLSEMQRQVSNDPVPLNTDSNERERDQITNIKSLKLEIQNLKTEKEKIEADITDEQKRFDDVLQKLSTTNTLSK